MAAPANVSGFLSLISQSGLVDPAGLEGYLVQLGALPPGPDELAGLLVRDGLLTRFQAEQLLRGWGKGFFLGQYRLLDRIGAGGMGEVFLGEHRGLGRLAALKVLPAEQAEDPLSLARFQREAQAVAALDHPNIVHAFDLEMDRGVWFLVLEYVEGADLQDLVARRGPLAVGRAADYARQAAAGLQHAFVAGLVHRDIKPANLLVSRDGVVKILDMGLARFFRDGSDLVTREFDDRAILGTADYLAPEQGRDSHEVDIRADLYSLGATLFFLLAGQPPFAGGSLNQKLMAHQMKPAPDVRSLRSEVPAELAGVVDRLLAKGVAERYQTPAEVVAALGPWRQEPPLALAAEDLPPGRPALGPRSNPTGFAGPRSSASASTRVDFVNGAPEGQTPAAGSSRSRPLIPVVSAAHAPPRSRPLIPVASAAHAPPRSRPVIPAVPRSRPVIPVASPPQAPPRSRLRVPVLPTGPTPIPVAPAPVVALAPTSSSRGGPRRGKRRNLLVLWLAGLLLLIGLLTVGGIWYLATLPVTAPEPTPAPTDLPVPLGLRVKPRTGGGVDLEWRLLDATGLTFRVERAGDAMFLEPVVVGETEPGALRATDAGGQVGRPAYYRVAARANGRQSAYSAVAWLPPTYADGFRPEGLVCNNGAGVKGGVLQLIDAGPARRFPGVAAGCVTAGAEPGFAPPLLALNVAALGPSAGDLNQQRSVFYFVPLDVRVFTTTFRLRLGGGDRTAEGVTFCLQSVGPTQVGHGGGGLGYEGLGRSVAVKFDLRDNQGEGPNSTGVFSAGQAPLTIGSVDLGPSGIELHSGRPLDVTVGYTHGSLYVTLVDTLEPRRRFSRQFAVDLPVQVGGPTAYAGFTASTSGPGVDAEVLSWTWSPGMRP